MAIKRNKRYNYTKSLSIIIHTIISFGFWGANVISLNLINPRKSTEKLLEIKRG